MSTAKRYTYVDFRQEPVTGCFAKTTHAIAASTNTLQWYTRVGSEGHYFEFLNIDTNTKIFPVADASGWLLPDVDTDAIGGVISQGIVAGAATKMKFVTGTDAFYLKCKLLVTDIDNFDVIAIGFRELAAYAVTIAPATLKTDYDHKALIGVFDDAGAVVTEVSTAAGADVETACTGTPIVTGTAFTWEVRIRKDLSVEFYVNGVLDALAAAATPVVTTGKTLIPHIVHINTGTGTLGTIHLQTYECGLLES